MCLFLAALVAILSLLAQGALTATIRLPTEHMIEAKYQVNDTCEQAHSIERRDGDPGPTHGGPDDLIASGFTIVPASFTGNFGPNGESMTLNGTIEEVVAQVSAINPAYNWTFSTAVTPAHANLNLNRRDEDEDEFPWRKLDVDFLDCDISKGGRALKDNINYGATNYLGGIGGRAKMEKKMCSRVSCSYDAAIYLCYDPAPCVKDAIYEVDWSRLGMYALGISEEWCPTVRGKKSGFPEVGGKVWDPRGMAVHVRGDWC